MSSRGRRRRTRSSAGLAVARMVDMGFAEDAARTALENAGGDEDVAVHKLKAARAIDTLADSDVRWRMTQSFLLRNGITSPRQRGYEHFMSVLLPEIIQRTRAFTQCARLEVGEMSFGLRVSPLIRPKFEDDEGAQIDINPTQAMQRRTTYECSVKSMFTIKSTCIPQTMSSWKPLRHTPNTKCIATCLSSTFHAWFEVDTATGTIRWTPTPQTWGVTSSFKAMKRE